MRRNTILGHRRMSGHFPAKALAGRQPALGTVLAILGCWITTPSVLAAPETGDPIRIAQAAAPLIVKGPLEVAAGARAPMPVTVNPGSPPAGRYVVIYRAPNWLSFTNGQRVGQGIWLIEREKLASVEVALADNATGQQEFTVASGSKSGAIDWETKLLIKVANAVPQAAPATVTEPPSNAQAAAPSAKAAEAAPRPPAATEPAETTVAQAAPPAGDAPVTWERMIGGGASGDAAKPAAKPATAPAAAKPAAPPRTDADLIREAKHLVRECTTCHNLYGTDVGIPVMVGLTVDRFIDTIDSYRREKRDHKLMQVIAKSLTE
ncbi:MAG: hypothetical protein AB7L18_06840, partial [Hyphomicrobiaceae bacterium]